VTVVTGQLAFEAFDELLRAAAGLRDVRRVPVSDGAARLLYALAERGLPARSLRPAAALALELDAEAASERLQTRPPNPEDA
jgi:hypothetical protein